MTDKRIHTLYLYLMYISLVAVGLSLVSLIVCPLLGWDTRYMIIPIAVGIPFLLLLGIAAPFHGASQKAIRRILSGEGQVIHWSYSEQEWQQFTTQAWRRGIKTDLVIAGALVGFMLVIGLFILGVSNGAPGAISAMEISLGITFAVSLLFPLKDVILLRIRRGQSGTEAYISPAGIILGGWYTPLTGLERINYQAGEPAVLGFVTRHSDGRGGTSTRTIEVPVPRGREAEAEQLVSDFKGK